jgi:hypothetical protein
MNEGIQLFLIMLIFLEIFEFMWQRGDNFQEYVANLFYFYKKNLILFFLLHPTVYFVIFAQLTFSNYSFFATALTLVKVFDLSFKITLLDKIYNKKELGAFAPLLKLNYPISRLLKASGVIIYPCLFLAGYMFS